MKIISEHKKIKKYQRNGQKATPLEKGYKRVMVSENGQTKHIDIKI
jgi:hypothetical protein